MQQKRSLNYLKQHLREAETKAMKMQSYSEKTIQKELRSCGCLVLWAGQGAKGGMFEILNILVQTKSAKTGHSLLFKEDRKFAITIL